MLKEQEPSGSDVQIKHISLKYLFEGNGERPGDGEALAVAQLAGERGQVADGDVVLFVDGGARQAQRARHHHHPQPHTHADGDPAPFTALRPPANKQTFLNKHTIFLEIYS